MKGIRKRGYEGSGFDFLKMTLKTSKLNIAMRYYVNHKLQKKYERIKSN